MTIAQTLETIEAHADVVVEDTTKATREDWLRVRREGIGGSDAASALGLNPWKSAYALFEDKAHGIVDEQDNERMEWGRRLEGPIVQAYGERAGIEVTPHPVMLRSKEYPWMQVNLDAIGPSLAVEAKNVGLRMASEWDEGNVPDWYMLQGMHELAVIGLPKVIFTVLIGGQELRIIEVERDDGLIADLVEQERIFWDLVKSNTPPAIDGSSSTSQALKLRYPDPDPESMVELPRDAITGLLAARATLKAEVKQSESDLDVVENTIKSMLGDREIGVVNGVQVVSWKKHDRAGYTVAPTSYRKIHVPTTKKGKK